MAGLMEELPPQHDGSVGAVERKLGREFNADLFFVGVGDTVRRAIEKIDRNTCGIVLVVDGQQRLIGTVTDGDVRRLMLDRRSLEAPLSELLEHKRLLAHAQPVRARAGASPDELLRIMHANVVQQIPLVNEHDQVVGLVTLKELLPAAHLPVHAVIMAGGFGNRLKPLTTNLPKPMLPVGGKPLMEHIIKQLKTAGISRVSVTTHFMPETIIGHFGDGRKFGVEVEYIQEDVPLGTAGSLRLLKAGSEPLLVINGDILTEVDFGAFYTFHRQNAASLTVGVRQFDLQVPYGVVINEGTTVRAIVEKPFHTFLVNAGIYLLEPSVRDLVSASERFDMPDLIRSLVGKGHPVVSFLIREYWLDIGRPNDYQLAQEHLINQKRAAA